MSLYRSLIAASLLTVAWMSPASAASDTLTRGEVYRLINQAQLLLRNRPPRPARQADVLVPQDGIKTASRSRVELLFNEGSLARIGSNAVFRFIPGMRGFQLRNGVALIMSPPTSAATRIETLEGQAIAELPATAANIPPANQQGEAYQTLSLAMVIQVDGVANQSNFFNLTNNPIKIFDAKGNSVVIRAGETVSVLNGTLGPVKTFNLNTFYKTSALATGLGPGQDNLIVQEAPRVQQTLRSVRSATLTALTAQTRALEGLCTLNARGGASTLSTNCITTDSDDPLRGFQNRRDVVTPIPERPQPQPEPPQTPNTPETSTTPTIPTTPIDTNPNGGVTGVPVLVNPGNNSPR